MLDKLAVINHILNLKKLNRTQNPFLHKPKKWTTSIQKRVLSLNFFSLFQINDVQQDLFQNNLRKKIKSWAKYRDGLQILGVPVFFFTIAVPHSLLK